MIHAINLLIIVALIAASVVVEPAQAATTPLAQQQSGAPALSGVEGWQYPLQDGPSASLRAGLGSVRHLTDPLGQVVQSYRFSPFGVPLGASGGEPYGYTGEHWDAATGLLYLRARWYDPATGRFLTRDPFPGLATLPTTQHPYVYVGNNPVNLTDPSGEFAFVIPLLLGAAIGGGLAAYNYWQAQPCAAPPSLLSDPGFLRAVGIGMLTGAVGGLIGGGVAILGAGAFGGGLAGAIITGAVGGGLIGGVGEALTQLALYGQIRNPQLVGAAMLGGVVSGGVVGAVGYGIGRVVRAVRASAAGGGTVKPTWPKGAEEMDEFLGVRGERIPDKPYTPGRNKVIWRPSDKVRITYEQHPYHPNAPEWHRNPHWHLDFPGTRHQRYLPGDPIPGF